MLRSALIAFVVLALAACGQPPSTSTGASPATTASAAPSPEQIAAALAALPAPYAQGDYDAGRRVFAQCRSCHTIDAAGGNRVGPNLHGVVGRHAAAAAGFTYSDALKKADFAWDGEHLDHWVAGPQAYLPGNRMAFVGVRDETQRRDVIAYLMVESAR